MSSDFLMYIFYFLFCMSLNLLITLNIFWYMELLFSHSIMSDTLQPHVLHHTRPPCPSLTPRACPNSCPSSWWFHPFHPLSSPSPPALNLSQHQGFFFFFPQWTGSLYQVAKALELKHQSFQQIFRVDFLSDWLVWSCSPWESEESSTAPQFEGINSSVLSLLYGPTLTSQFSFSFFWLAEFHNYNLKFLMS